ncbi:hypothetical protein L1987_16557 [Smallanthus sonchifolius]|uniref:Uncharacterized protein n=1 Tax=Smallanthus sonchifolius TaxID=185202 RepID=A0ACB9JAU3_9ASTR|nr:hypothetical protein L1987_16557 [Smallanthus sonchifolius]
MLCQIINSICLPVWCGLLRDEDMSTWGDHFKAELMRILFFCVILSQVHVNFLSEGYVWVGLGWNSLSFCREFGGRGGTPCTRCTTKKSGGRSLRTDELFGVHWVTSEAYNLEVSMLVGGFMRPSPGFAKDGDGTPVTLSTPFRFLECNAIFIMRIMGMDGLDWPCSSMGGGVWFGTISTHITSFIGGRRVFTRLVCGNILGKYWAKIIEVGLLVEKAVHLGLGMVNWTNVMRHHEGQGNYLDWTQLTRRSAIKRAPTGEGSSNLTSEGTRHRDKKAKLYLTWLAKKVAIGRIQQKLYWRHWDLLCMVLNSDDTPDQEVDGAGPSSRSNVGSVPGPTARSQAQQNVKPKPAHLTFRNIDFPPLRGNGPEDVESENDATAQMMNIDGPPVIATNASCMNNMGLDGPTQPGIQIPQAGVITQSN